MENEFFFTAKSKFDVENKNGRKSIVDKQGRGDSLNVENPYNQSRNHKEDLIANAPYNTQLK